MTAEDPQRSSGDFVRRAGVHLLLSLLATPLAGGALTVGRAVHMRRLLAAAALAVLAVGATAGGVYICLSLPLSLAACAAALAAVWSGAGLALAWLERAFAIAPPVDRDPPMLLRRVALWAVSVPIGWIPVAFVIAGLSTRWGIGVFAKPSMPLQVLESAALWLIPLGVVVGLSRGLLGRRFRVTAPLAFTAALPVVVVLLSCWSLLYIWLLEDVLHLVIAEGVSDRYLTDLGVAALVLSVMVPFVLLCEYFCQAEGVRDFAVRCALASGVVPLFLGNMSLFEGSLPLSLWHDQALTAVAAGDEAAAAGAYAMTLRRAPLAEGAPLALERGALTALLSGDPDLARRHLERTRAQLCAIYPCAELTEMADRLLLSELDVADAVTVPIRPVRPEDYLDTDWCTVLSAVWAARPQLSETELKHQLQTLSVEAEAIDLPYIVSFEDLRVVARAFDTEPVLIDPDGIAEQLAAGSSVLFRDPLTGLFGLIIWHAKGIDAIQWLDYERWDRERERRRDSSEIEQLVLSSDLDEATPARVLAEVRRLDTAERIRSRIALDGGGWFAVLVPRRDDDLRPTEREDGLVALLQARRALTTDDTGDAARFVRGAPASPARDELMDLIAVSEHARSLRLGEGGLGIDDSIERLLTRPLEALSPWALSELCNRTFDTPELGCESVARIIVRLAELYPDDVRLQQELMYLRSAEGDGAGASMAAERMVRAGGFEDELLLLALDALVPVAASDGDARAALRRFLARVPPLVEDDGVVRPRRTVAAVNAARGSLETRPARALQYWRKASELAPRSSTYRLELARVLDASGDPIAGARARADAKLLRGSPRCQSRTPVCSAQ